MPTAVFELGFVFIAFLFFLLQQVFEKRNRDLKNLAEAEQQKLLAEQEQENREREVRNRAALERAAREATEQKSKADQHKDTKVQAEQFTHHTAIDVVIRQVRFTAKEVQAGLKQVGEREIGRERVECPYPTGETEIRPMRSLFEYGMLLPSQSIDPEIQLIKIVSGEALVAGHVEERAIMEPIYKPVIVQLVRALYILLDVSPSMFEGHNVGALAPSFWKSLTCALIDHARKNEAVVLFRGFSSGVSSLHRARDREETEALKRAIQTVGQGSGTEISGAVQVAIQDFQTEFEKGLDQSEVVIITDGQDNFDAIQLRKKLDERNIKLRAVLLGTDNNALATAAHTSQIVAADFKVTTKSTEKT